MKEISISELLDYLVRLLEKSEGRRVLIGVSGAPASGKSTLAESLVEQLNSVFNKKVSAIIPQDGFHYDDSVLKSMNRLSFKGAPDTFDVNGLVALLKRLVAEDEVAIPLFDRELEVSRNSARIITAENKLLIMEGNYLLLNNHKGWKKLKPFFDHTILLSVPILDIEKRLIQRWVDYGYTAKDAHEKVHRNDLINANTVINESLDSDFVLLDQNKI